MGAGELSGQPEGVMNGPSKFSSARKIRLLLELLTKFYWVPLFACARIFLQVLACSVFSEAIFL